MLLTSGREGILEEITAVGLKIFGQHQIFIQINGYYFFKAITSNHCDTTHQLEEIWVSGLHCKRKQASDEE